MAWIAFAAFLLAFAVRLYWVLRVQSPHGAVYSDMGGYVARAEELLGGPPGPDPRLRAFYPWGTHVLIALELVVFGRHSLVGIAIAQSLVGALPVPCVALLTARFFTGAGAKRAAAVAGCVAALWHPQITYAGYFMSEVWFTGALLPSAWLFVRHAEGRRGTLAAGCALAAAYVIRPQVLLTMILVAGALVLGIAKARRLSRARWALLLAPFLAIAVASAVRFHALSGRYGLISENDGIMRLFADTSVGRVEATWVLPSGVTTSAWFSPGTKHPLRPEDVVSFKGYIADPQILEGIRKERLQGVPWTSRTARRFRNITFLVWRNLPNPEADFRADPRRAFLQRFFRDFTLWLLPLAILGIREMWVRSRMAAAIVLANLVTVIAVAAFYFAEARYRVPYDPFLIVAATVGAAVLVRGILRVVDALRSETPTTANRSSGGGRAPP